MMLYEWRVYDIPAGKLDHIHKRFRETTMGLFRNHDINVVIFLEKVEDDGSGQLQYLCSFESMDARNKAFADFVADPEWTKAREESEADGPIVTKVHSTFLKPTDYSPTV